MSSYFAQVSWQRQAEEIFTDKQYSRLHQWQFDEGVSVPASSSVHAVPLPYSPLPLRTWLKVAGLIPSVFATWVR